MQMSENTEKKPAFDKKITPELMAQLRARMKEIPETNHYARAKKLAPEFPMFSERTLVDYSRLIINVCDEVFQMHLDGKISQTALSEFGVWEKKTQIYMATEYVDKKLTPSLLRIIKQLKREHDMGFEEAIGRATGAIPMDKPRKEDKRTLDQILAEIADKGARWRAMVDVAVEMIGDEEAAGGVHMTLFEKVAVLRELIGNQYDMVNGRFNRYMGVIKKRLIRSTMPEAEEIRDAPLEPERKHSGKIIDVEGTIVNETEMSDLDNQ